MIRPTPEAGSGLADDQLPGYQEALHAFHAAAAPELAAFFADLPPAARILDLACGDGCHGARLGERARVVVGLDRASACLHAARERGLGCLVRADAGRLPFAEGSFDLVWCAHSLGSLPDHRAALGEMVRVSRGWVAVMESDPVHRILLPWPPELELRVRRAQLAGLERLARAHGTQVEKYLCARSLPELFAARGLRDCRARCLVVERRAPLGADEELFLRGYFADVRERAWPHLTDEDRRALDALCAPDSSAYWPRQPHFRFTQLEIVALGRR